MKQKNNDRAQDAQAGSRAAVCSALIAIARAAHTLCDNTEDDGENLTIERTYFDDLCMALDPLDKLPEPGPNIVATGPAKAEAALSSPDQGFEVELLFHTSSSPKRLRVIAVYTKDALLCLQRPDGLLIKYPLVNIFQVAHFHGAHAGSSVQEYLPGEAQNEKGQTPRPMNASNANSDVTAGLSAPTGSEALLERINDYLCKGGLFNPEMMEHDKVRDLLNERGPVSRANKKI